MLSAGDRIGPYTLVNKLGQGSFGTVWLAERRTSIVNTKVALKIPLDEQVDLNAIRQEASLWVMASGHPNVLPIIEADVYNSHVVIASEYAPDGSLEEWLEAHGGSAPSIDIAFEIASGILAGLEHLHSRRIIHRDLKPANLLLQGDTPRLADFGISRVLKTTSQSMTVAGSPAYMAPEAFDGKRNEQTDIWSAGVILYQLLAGHLPFQQPDFTSLMAAILTKDPLPLSFSIPSSIREVVARALDKDTGQRFKSAADMRVALRNALKVVNERDTSYSSTVIDTSPSEATPETQPGQPYENTTFQTAPYRTTTSRRSLFIWFSIMAALVLAFAVFITKSAINKSRDNDSITTKADATSPPVSHRTLSYWITMKEDSRRSSGSASSRLPGEIMFEKGDAVRLHFVSPQPGYLYIVNEGPTSNEGLPDYNLLFPSPTTNNGSARLNANQETQIPQTWFVFDAQEGTEKLWLLWSAQGQPALEAVKQTWAENGYKGEIKSPETTKALQDILTSSSLSNSSVQKDDEKKQTTVMGKGDTLIYLISLEHH